MVDDNASEEVTGSARLINEANSLIDVGKFRDALHCLTIAEEYGRCAGDQRPKAGSIAHRDH